MTVDTCHAGSCYVLRGALLRSPPLPGEAEVSAGPAQKDGATVAYAYGSRIWIRWFDYRDALLRPLGGAARSGQNWVSFFGVWCF